MSTIPTDELFQDGVVFSNILFDEIDRFRTSWEDIDWDQDVQGPSATREALAQAATQFQYGNMSHLILCGKVVKNEVETFSMDTTKLGIVLAAYKAEGIDIWGRYLQKLDATAAVSSEMQRYYQHLFSADDADTLLLGMETLAGPTVHQVYQSLERDGDTLFDQIIFNFVAQKEQEIELTAKFLSDVIAAHADAGQERVSDAAHMYRSIALNILEANMVTVELLGQDPDALYTDIAAAIDRFYEDIGVQGY